MASLPGLFKAVGPAEEESGDLDGSLQQMLKAIADERSRLNQRQEVSGLGECACVRPCERETMWRHRGAAAPGLCGPGRFRVKRSHVAWHEAVVMWLGGGKLPFQK